MQDWEEPDAPPSLGNPYRMALHGPDLLQKRKRGAKRDRSRVRTGLSNRLDCG
jgi:hypothetical protein